MEKNQIKRAVNIRDIAEAANCSIATVSRALQQPPSPKISDKKRQEIKEICEKLHYVPNVHNQRAFQGRSHTIAFFFHSHKLIEQDPASANTDLNFSSALMGAHRELAAKGFELLLVEVTPELLKEKRHLGMVRSKLLDGALVWGPHDGDDYIRELHDEGLPMVQVSGQLLNSDIASVNADDYQGMREMTRALIQAGHRNIAVLPPSTHSEFGRQRVAGVLDELKVHNINPAITFKEGIGYTEALPAARQLLENQGEISCVIASDDMAAWAFIDTFMQAGKRIPEDLSVTGADGIFFPGNIQLDSYIRPSGEVGQDAAKLLLRLIKNSSSVSKNKLILPIKVKKGNTIAIIK